ncbi:copper chaperone PCu(A)C [Vibrio rarus]|uniref:copper chaperone PCu(A)C n=1 Tax=Vibrio rarus TaxID=413403 RepID=UPI0021C47ECE|nr:copper chaperone PCu(A)C [Vibrio rarus]
MITRFTALILVLLSPFVYAHNLIEVSDAFAKETPPTSTTSAIFLTIDNPTTHDRALISAVTPMAQVTELHTHAMQDGIMKMRKLQRINVPAKSKTVLKPHGLHVMLFGLKEPLKEGMIVPLTLTFDSGRVLNLSVPVKKMKMMKH